MVDQALCRDLGTIRLIEGLKMQGLAALEPAIYF